MRPAYQLSPIPPFRGQVTRTTPVSVSPPSSIDSQPHSLPPVAPTSTTAKVYPDPQYLPDADAISQLTSFSFNKKRPAPLQRYSRSNLHLIDPDGLSAPSPPSPLVYQQHLNDLTGVSSPGSPGPVCPLLGGKDVPHHSHVPPRFQPGRATAQDLVGSSSHSGTSKLQLGNILKSNPDNRPAGKGDQQPLNPKTLQQVVPLRNGPAGGRGSVSIPMPDVNLTPPPTPNSREPELPPATVVKSLGLFFKSNNLQLPPTPNTSPYNKGAALTPTTVSAKALASHKLHEVFLANYTLGDELGSGGFGFVVQATRNKDLLKCAVKFIYKEKVPQQAWVKDELWGDESDINGIMRTKEGIKRVPLEAYVLKTIRHRGVVSFVDLFEDKTYIYLVMEHHGSPWTALEKENKAPTSSAIVKEPSISKPTDSCGPLVTNGLQLDLSSGSRKSSLTLPPPMPSMNRRSSCDLFECIEQHSRLPERYAKYVFAQLVDVVGCLHYNGFVHRDIKDENIVIDDKYRMKLIDFGSTYLFDYRQEPQTLNRFFGTLNFAAPELVRKGSYQPMAAEIWSLGILLSILVTGESFFHDTEAIKNYKASPPNNPISDSCMDLIFRCLAYKPEDRWNCFRIRNHPWLADCQWPWSDLPADACCDSITRVRKR